MTRKRSTYTQLSRYATREPGSTAVIAFATAGIVASGWLLTQMIVNLAGR